MVPVICWATCALASRPFAVASARAGSGTPSPTRAPTPALRTVTGEALSRAEASISSARGDRQTFPVQTVRIRKVTPLSQTAETRDAPLLALALSGGSSALRTLHERLCWGLSSRRPGLSRSRCYSVSLRKPRSKVQGVYPWRARGGWGGGSSAAFRRSRTTGIVSGACNAAGDVNRVRFARIPKPSPPNQSGVTWSPSSR